MKINEITAQAVGKWDYILNALGLEVGNGKHCPCPACGGKDRFRFDNKDGRGTYICNQCGAGDGLDLVKNFFNCSNKEASIKVAECLNVSENHNKTTDKNNINIQDNPVCKKVEYLLSQSKLGQSEYLTKKGLTFDLPLLDDGRIFAPLVNIKGEYTGAQFIHADGSKQLMKGTNKKGSFIVINNIKVSEVNAKLRAPNQVIICEGIATGITLSLIDSDSIVLSAIDAGNLIHVARSIREVNPTAKIIIAGDNDIGTDKNVGKDKAIESAKAVNGYYSLPDADYKCDWDDYRQKYDTDKAKQDFYKSIKKAESDLQTKTKLPLSIGSAGFNTQLSYVVKDIIPANSLCSIYGASGSYKSFLATSWACHISSGLTWGNKKVSKGAVLYIVGEGGIGVPRRIKAWELNHQQVITNLYLINTPVFPASKNEVMEVLKVANHIERETKLPLKMIVIDTLARCFGGSDENDAKDMGAFIRGCDELKAKTGATVLVVHHSGKDESKGARGSSAFRASLDAEYRINREGKGGALIMSCTKMKDAEEMETTAYDLKTVNLFIDDDNETVTSLCVADQPRKPVEEDEINLAPNVSNNHAILWSCVRHRTQIGDPCTKAIIRDDLKAMGVDIKNFGRWLSKLVKDGLVTIDGEIIHIINKRKSPKNEEKSE